MEILLINYVALSLRSLNLKSYIKEIEIGLEIIKMPLFDSKEKTPKF